MQRSMISHQVCARLQDGRPGFFFSQPCRAAVPRKEGAVCWTRGPSTQRSVRQSSRRKRISLPTRAVFEHFTERSIKAVMLSQCEAKILASCEVGPVHVLLGLLALDPRACRLYLGPTATIEGARAALSVPGSRYINDSSSSSDIPFTAGAKRVFEAAQQDAKRRKHNYVSPEHILLAVLASKDHTTRRLLLSLNVNVPAAEASAQKALHGDHNLAKQMAYAGHSSKEHPQHETSSKMLESFCIDLCEAAREQRVDPVIGRGTEVRRVLQILGRRTKNSPILLGEPGTGKTAIAEAIALAAVEGQHSGGHKTPDFLQSKRILQLDIGALLSGSKERGELEKRITALLHESAASGNVILEDSSRIDEIHQIVGAGAVGRTSGFAGSGLDIGNLLKPALARGHLQVIGATTMKEFRKYFENDAALERRFQPVHVNEPSAAQTVLMLRGLQERYERHHGCTYLDEAVVAAVTLSSRYIADRSLPDKAIDVLDEAGSRARISAFRERQQAARGSLDQPRELLLELQDVLDAKAAYSQEELWEEVDQLHRTELHLKQRLSGVWQGLPAGALLPQVRFSDIAAVVSEWTGIPSPDSPASVSPAAVNIAEKLKRQVVGQDHAAKCVASAMQRAVTGLRDPRRPVAALMLTGPTGVGKTHLARALASAWSGSDACLVQLDMSEFTEKHAVTKMIGPPPGFEGYKEGGKLTEAVRRQPHCLLLLDELEKAHPDVCNLLLQILEDGRLTDSQGRKVAFNHALIIMTSNVGANCFDSGQLGFDLSYPGADRDCHAAISHLVREELKAVFRPELLNRIDEIVTFRQLSASNLHCIAQLLVQEVSSRMQQAHGTSVQLSQRLLATIVDASAAQAYGARPLRRNITRMVEDPLADAILAGQVLPHGFAFLDLAPDGKAVAISHRAEPHAGHTTLKSAIIANPLRKKMNWAGSQGQVV